MTSSFLHQSEFGSYFCGANTRGLYVALRGDLDIREKTKMAEDGESSLRERSDDRKCVCCSQAKPVNVFEEPSSNSLKKI